MSFSIRQIMAEKLSPRKPPLKKHKYSNSASANSGSLTSLELSDPETIQDIHRLIVNLTHTQESYKTEIKETIQSEVAKIKEELEGQFSQRINTLELGLIEKDERIQKLEQKLESIQVETEEGDFPIDKTMVVLKLPFSENENLSNKVSSLMQEMGLNVNEVNVVKESRLPIFNQYQRTSPLVKVQFSTKAERDAVVSQGRNLRQSQNYRGVFVRASLPKSERQSINNFRQIIMTVPGLKDYLRVSPAGKVMPNRYQEPNMQYQQPNQIHQQQQWRQQQDIRQQHTQQPNQQPNHTQQIPTRLTQPTAQPNTPQQQQQQHGGLFDNNINQFGNQQAATNT